MGSTDTTLGIEANVSSHQSAQREKRGRRQTERQSGGMGELEGEGSNS